MRSLIYNILVCSFLFGDHQNNINYKKVEGYYLMSDSSFGFKNTEEKDMSTAYIYIPTVSSGIIGKFAKNNNFVSLGMESNSGFSNDELVVFVQDKAPSGSDTFSKSFCQQFYSQICRGYLCSGHEMIANVGFYLSSPKSEIRFYLSNSFLSNNIKIKNPPNYMGDILYSYYVIRAEEENMRYRNELTSYGYIKDDITAPPSSSGQSAVTPKDIDFIKSNVEKIIVFSEYIFSSVFIGPGVGIDIKNINQSSFVFDISVEQAFYNASTWKLDVSVNPGSQIKNSKREVYESILNNTFLLRSSFGFVFKVVDDITLKLTLSIKQALTDSTINETKKLQGESTDKFPSKFNTNFNMVGIGMSIIAYRR